MGFRLDRTYVLLFDDYPQLDEFRVDIRATPVSVTVELRELSWVKDASQIADLLTRYVAHWNYADLSGETLPIVPESFLSLEQPLFLAIVKEWYMAATGVTAPLEQTSIDTSAPELASVPMEAS